jgi:DNA-binding transcriptional MerR regulator
MTNAPRAGEPAADQAGARSAPAASGMLKMSELSERSGVSAGTIKHYLREGLLGPDQDVLRTSRNMAYYPEDFVGRIQLIKRLQEERFMPLRVIRDVVAQDPEQAARLIELEDRILERARAGGSPARPCERPTTCPATCSTDWPSSGC